MIGLGSTADLVRGYDHSWRPGDAATSPFAAPGSSVLKVSPIATPKDPGKWGEGPDVTLCATATDLISAIYDIGLESADGTTIPSGPLVLDNGNRNAAAADLEKWLGVDLSTDAGGYALVRLVRTAEATSHDAIDGAVVSSGWELAQSVTPDGRVALQATEPFGQKYWKYMTGRLAVTDDFVDDPDLDTARDVLTSLGETGTHYVAGATFGGVIFQVFEYTADRFATIEQTYASDPSRLSGPFAISFEVFTGLTDGDFGYVKTAGNLLSFNDRDQLASDIKAGDWSTSSYLDSPSVFSAFDLSGPNLDDYDTNVVTGYTIRSLVDHIAQPRRSTWTAVVHGAIYQKFGAAMGITFPRVTAPDWATIYPQEPGFLSTLATPTIDAYKERIDLSDLELAFPEIVENLTLVTNVLRVPNGSKPLSIPGSDICVVAHAIDVGADGEAPPVVEMAHGALEDLTVACQDVNGAFVMRSDCGSSSYLVVDGLVYGTTPADSSGITGVAVLSDIRQDPSVEILEAVLDDLSVSLVACQALLDGATRASSDAATDLTHNPNSKTFETQLVLKRYLNWIGLSVPSDTSNTDLLSLRVQALYLARVAATLKLSGVHVPYTTYSAYKDLVGSITGVLDTVERTISQYQQQIQSANATNAILKDIGELNKNIIANGKLLSQFIADTAQQQADIEGFYEGIVTTKKTALRAELAQLKELSASVSEQQLIVSQQVDDYKTAYGEWETEEIIKTSLEVAADLLTAGLGLASELESTVKALKAFVELAVAIAKAVEAFAAMSEMFETLLETTEEMTAADAAMLKAGFDGVQVPTKLEWDEFLVNITNLLDQGPNIPEKGNLLAAFKILVLRAEAQLSTSAQVQQTSGEIYQYSKQAETYEKQKDRLSKLSETLDTATPDTLDRSKVDLLGLTGSSLLVQRRMLSMLVSSLVLQREAIQYEYLATPAAPTSFDLLGLKIAMVSNERTIVEGIENLQPPPAALPQPVVVTVENVPVSSITGGDAYAFSIPLSQKEFWPFAMVRASKVVVGVEGITGTTGGTYEVDASWSGAPFDDRGPDRDVLAFNSRRRLFNYLYEAGTNTPKFASGTGTWGDEVQDITPFSQWTVSLPDNEANAGIEFDSASVDITLSFDITALLRDPASATPLSMFTGAEDSATTAQPTAPQVMADMAGKTVMRGWDAVLSFTEGKVNEILSEQWDTRKTNSKFFWEIPKQTFKKKFSGGTAITEYALTFASPNVQFTANNPGATTLTLPVLSGTYSYGVIIDGKTSWLVKNASPGKDDVLTASVPLAKASGSVTGNADDHDVVLDLASGSFQAQKMSFAGGNPTFNDAVANFMQTAAPKFVINTISYTDKSQSKALTPTTFALNTMTTPSGVDLLQVFVATEDPPAANHGTSLAEPVPQGSDASLLINSKIAFQDVLIGALQGSAGLTAVAPQANTNDAWSAQVSNWSISGTYPNSSSSRISASSNKVNVSLNGMTFTAQGDGSIKAAITTQFNQGFEYWVPGSAGICGASTPGHWAGATLPVTIDISFPIRLATSGTQGNQSIGLDVDTATVNITGKLDASGACKTNDREVQQTFLHTMQNQFPPELKNALAVKFESLSLFALENLLFPASNTLNFGTSGVPGDLVVFGNLAVPPAGPS